MDRALFHYAYDLRETPEGLVPLRFTPRQFHRFAEQGDFIDRNAKSTGGVALRFVTDAPEIAVDYAVSGLTQAESGFDVWENGVFTAHLPAPAEAGAARASYRKRFPGASEFCVYLPHHGAAAIRGVELGNYTCVPQVAAPRFLFCGASSTRDAYIPYPSLVFPAAVARRFGADYLNRGVGSTKFDPAALDDELRYLPDAVFVQYGGNDLVGINYDLGRVGEALDTAREYLETTARLYPRAKVFVISCFWNVHYEAVPGRRALTDAYSAGLLDMAAALGQIPVDGMRLHPHLPESVVADGTHLTVFGNLTNALGLIRAVEGYF